MRTLERHPIEGEIGKPREHLRLRLALEITPASVAIAGDGSGSHEHDPRALQWVARLALIEHERDPRIGENILGVHGKPRDQQEWRTVSRSGNIHQRAVGIA